MRCLCGCAFLFFFCNEVDLAFFLFIKKLNVTCAEDEVLLVLRIHGWI